MPCLLYSPGGMVALGPECCVYLEQQLRVLLRVMTAEIKFGYKFHMMCLLSPTSGVGAVPAVGLSFAGDFSKARGGGGGCLSSLQQGRQPWHAAAVAARRL